MEMMAAIAALKCLKQPCRVVLTTDSNYLVKGMTQWLPGWIRSNWINSQKEPVKNKELWKQLLDLSHVHKIQWKHVRGHRGHPENERCDRLARDAIKGCI
jgi:ribonuclease HI